MKAFLTAAMALALLTAPASAQGLKSKGGGHKSDQATEPHKKDDDKGYRSAIAKVPDQNQKIDPWRNVR